MKIILSSGGGENEQVPLLVCFSVLIVVLYFSLSLSLVLVYLNHYEATGKKYTGS